MNNYELTCLECRQSVYAKNYCYRHYKLNWLKTTSAPIKHGSEYSYQRCHCDLCRQAHAETAANRYRELAPIKSEKPVRKPERETSSNSAAERRRRLDEASAKSHRRKQDD